MEEDRFYRTLMMRSDESSARGTALPSFAQEGIALFEVAFPATCVQHVAARLSVTGQVELARVKQSVAALAEKCPLLRSKLEFSHGAPRIVDADTPIPVAGWSSSTGSEAFLREQAESVFNLAEGPLLRVAVVSHTASDHVMLVVAHRIAADWPALVRIAALLVEQLATGKCSLPAPAAAYGEFATRQRERTASAEFSQLREWWKARLAGPLPVLQLPAEGRRATHRTFAAGEVRVALPPDIGRRVAAHSGASEPPAAESLLLAAFAALLMRYSGQSELILGWNASLAGTLPSPPPIGPLENWLALRVECEATESFEHLHAIVASQAQDAWRQRELPFDVVLRETAVAARSAAPPLIQALFESRTESLAAFPSSGPLTVVDFTEATSAASFFDLHLVVTRRDDAFDLSLRFNRELFGRQRGERFLAHFTQLLDSALRQPALPVARLPLLADDERRHIVADFNATAAPYPGTSCLHQLIQEQAERTPESTAYVFEGQSFSYRRVCRWANAISRRLRGQGIGKGHFVPLLMDRSIELPLSMLAVMKAGAAYVPLDVHWPANRTQHIIRDTECRVVLVKDPSLLAEQIPPGVMALAIDIRDLEEDDVPVSSQISSDDPIYMIYTSGSTGVPKGAINKHRGIINRLSYMTRRYGCAPQDVILQTSAHIFDASVWQYFWPLLNGAQSVLPSPMAGFDHRHITELIGRYGVTVTDFVPSVFNILVDILEKDSELHGKLKSLRQILIGGEALSPHSIFRFKQRFPHVGITNTYGPTETSIGCIFYEAGQELEDPLPIGQPIANVHAYILDDFLQPVPIGVPGMLHVGGDCVGLGYHRDSAKTSAAFLANPFPEMHSGPIYRTGDLARYRESGNIEFLGRADHQVKIRGIRVELGEIEARLAQHPDVSAAVVNLRESPEGAKRLVAYIVAGAGSNPSTAELRAFLKETLPEYVIPGAFVRLQEIPLLRSGKVDRKALPPPPTDEQPAPERRGPPPRTPHQLAIAQAWREEIGIDHVSLRDNFFELGGDSLGAVRVLARLELESGIRLEAEQMMFQNLAQLAASLPGASEESIAQEGAEPPAPVVQPIYFGAADHRLFGCLHEVAEPALRGVVVCPPLGHEYIFSHRSLRHLAQLLAARNLPVLRFDFYGTGDSLGDWADLSLTACVDDTLTAVREQAARQGVDAAALVGLRVGATVASLAAARLPTAVKLVLWDPVCDGKAYLEALLATHTRLMGGRTARGASRQMGVAGEVEIIGMRIPHSLWSAIEAIGDAAYDSHGGRDILVVDSSEDGTQQAFVSWLTAHGVNAEYLQIPYPEIWNQDPYKTRLPSRIIEEVCRWLGKETA